MPAGAQNKTKQEQLSTSMPDAIHSSLGSAIPLGLRMLSLPLPLSWEYSTSYSPPPCGVAADTFLPGAGTFALGLPW